jgi:hypothetical protein
MGMALLQKMGWKPGEGLGKNKEGTLEPLQLEVKLDKKGLISDQDIGPSRLGKLPKVPVPVTKTLEGIFTAPTFYLIINAFSQTL